MKKFILILLIIIFAVFILMGCVPDDIGDDTVYPLGSSITSIEEGYPYVLQAVEEYRDDMYLNTVSSRFVGKESIKNRTGVMIYRFYCENVFSGIDAMATVWIDMDTSSQIRFNLSYGSPKELGGGGLEMYPGQYEIDLKDALDLAIGLEGEETVNNCESPAIVVGANDSFLDVTLYDEEENNEYDIPNRIWTVYIDPITGDIDYSEEMDPASGNIVYSAG